MSRSKVYRRPTKPALTAAAKRTPVTQTAKALHVDISDIVTDARAKALNAVMALTAKDPDATVDVTLTLFREAWQEATPGEGAIRLPSDSAVEDLDRATGTERADALSCTLSQIAGIVEIAIDTIEEHSDCTIGTRMCDATAALYGVVALAKGKQS
jgi:hypothetical protein